VDERLDYLEKLRRDLLEQFRGKPNIEVMQRALARQLDEVHEFFLDLNKKRWLLDAEGVQLDGVGDIVVLSRSEALTMSEMANLNVPMDDDLYRRYLAWKNALNTTNCTHLDVYRALQLFWDKSPLYYSEELEHPATIIFTTPELTPDQDVRVLFLAPKVKAAGVALRIVAITKTPDLGEIDIHVGGVAFSGIMQTTLPQWLPDGHLEGKINVIAHCPGVISQTILQELS